MRRFALTLLAAGLSACAPAAPTVTDAQKAAIADMYERPATPGTPWF